MLEAHQACVRGRHAARADDTGPVPAAFAVPVCKQLEDLRNCKRRQCRKKGPAERPHNGKRAKVLHPPLFFSELRALQQVLEQITPKRLAVDGALRDGQAEFPAIQWLRGRQPMSSPVTRWGKASHLHLCNDQSEA